MAFKLTNANVDVLNKTASVVWVEQPIPPAVTGKVVQTTFPFDPPHSEGKEMDVLKAEAKKTLQQILSEI
ncbi:MAG TPA: hypothetical protein VN655_15270 [Pseudolabrys sp.]|nr:hypothetical protein [Pseudolabrys sp.]